MLRLTLLDSTGLKLLFTAIVCVMCNLGFAQYSLTVESSPASAVAGQTVYRFYVDMQAPEDELSAVYGNSASNLIVNAPNGVFNSPANSSVFAYGINPVFLGILPELVDDTYATVGLDGQHLRLALAPQCKTQDLWRTPPSQSGRSSSQTALQPCQAQVSLDLHGMSP